MPEPIEFLDLDDVLQAHAEGLARWGGSAGIRDQAMLESAIAQPQAATADGEYNGWRLPEPEELLYLALLEIAERKMTREQLANLLRDLAGI